jgi:hypothetical protein
MEWCAHETGKPYYKGYLMLGDDVICNNKLVSDTYQQNLGNIGVSLSASKCTSSESGNAEFAKRLFTQEGEVTGIPVSILQHVRKQPEQVIELVRILREREYSDSAIRLGIENLFRAWKGDYPTKRRIYLALSASHDISGSAPLLTEDDALLLQYYNIDWSDSLPELSETKTYVDELLFWREVSNVFDDTVYSVSQSRKGKVQEFAHYNPVNLHMEINVFPKYFGQGGGEYYLYESWLEGKHREVLHLLGSDKYRTKSRGHKMTKCKFEFIQEMYRVSKEDLDTLPEIDKTVVTVRQVQDRAGALSGAFAQIYFGLLRDYSSELDYGD